ncbi:tRNA pseudouridine(55) synthase TruB [Oceanobacillus chungangensis]|uniref:tRNA pseudouridine synthase B n=1 Tax=Oceanobacillus chungangensis TaxID=1229152 RepID=A0A3D8PNW1_9BACI|nr:tRNA pseudouridine(55) synthase TruB [Oceanobacillus chungangensis]RDW17796.1 tRNA pseudouridine(55) synthase TruB [Oceanobacillus chungangensis]
MNGILPLWKPKGMTSHDCVMKCRRLFKTKKVGHTGTLDPEVEGVLPICIGEATKIVSFLTDTKKTYIAEVKLGTSTETEDAEGKIVEEKKVLNPPTTEKIMEVLQSFMGTITQIPPMYSAVKVNGRKLYEYARANEPVDRPQRKITIYDIQLLSTKTDSFKIKVLCSKGTYIRTLCVDIGKELGYPAHMSSLVRTETGSFSEKNTVTFANIEEAAEINEQQRLLVPIIHGVNHLDRLDVDEVTKLKVMNGQKLKSPTQVIKTNPFLVVHQQQLLAIYQNHPDKPEEIKPVRVFNG